MLAEIFADGTGQHRSQVLNPVLYRDHTIAIVNLMIPNVLLERYAWSKEFNPKKQRDSRYEDAERLRERLARSLHRVGRP